MDKISSSGTETKTDAILDALDGPLEGAFPLSVAHERRYYKDFPLQGDSFRQDLLKLTSGLDEGSVETVTRSLRRLRAIRESEEEAMSLYSEEEARTMAGLARELRTNVRQLSAGCWCYQGAKLPIRHFEPSVFQSRLMTPELAHPERLRDKDIVDAGAYIGDSALILAPLTDRRVYAFEPVPDNYALLQKTIELNGLENVETCPYALGEKETELTIAVNDSGAASTFFVNEAIPCEKKITVPVRRLDDVVREKGLTVGLIKADVEGAESLLLRGAGETLRTQRPALLISIYHNAADYFGIKPWLESLDLGYRFKIRRPVDGEVMTETVLIAEVP